MKTRATCGLILSLAPAGQPEVAATSVSIRAHGAKGDGQALDTASIQKALDDCAASGGGAVVFPAGSYLSGTIHLHSKVALWFEAGATLVGPTNLNEYRLPAEAEWEYACRAGTTGPFFWGDDEGQRNDYVWSGGNSGGAPHPVMTRNPNPWGLHDMNGSVYEYCADWFAMTPPVGPLTDPTGPAAPGVGDETKGEQWVVLRCGSWSTAPLHCRTAFRGGAPKDHRNRRDGFSILREVSSAQ